MRIPNADRAIIDNGKLVDYLLNPDHRRGGSKARLLLAFGYRREDPGRLESDLRDQHLARADAVERPTEFGMRYEIHAPLHPPRGRPLVVRSIWQIDHGSDVPRLLTMYPD